ncbi:hypothetical protein J3454_15735 [Erythrobacter sp. NFXS35]|uniref:hypothetical protein n=1 Tax=Erythrobacter sp. NFXS35 TaxID=2818436 RepID=UPI0032DF1337
MTSRRQIEANRRNAQRSTGPNTPEGRAISSANATRHAVLSSRFVAAHENRDLFMELRAELIEDFEPMTALELMLVERLAMLFWRERRLASAEAEQVELFHGTFPDPNGGTARSMPLANQYLVGRYQGMLGRQIRDTLKDLREERERHLQVIEVIESEEADDGEAEA